MKFSPTLASKSLRETIHPLCISAGSPKGLLDAHDNSHKGIDYKPDIALFIDF
jgi:hypothetical protein